MQRTGVIFFDIDTTRPEKTGAVVFHFCSTYNKQNAIGLLPSKAAARLPVMLQAW